MSKISVLNYECPTSVSQQVSRVVVVVVVVVTSDDDPLNRLIDRLIDHDGSVIDCYVPSNVSIDR